MPLFIGASESYDTDAWEAYNLKKENEKLRKLAKDMGELLDVLSDCDMVCKHYHDGCIGDCYYVNARRELGVEVASV